MIAPISGGSGVRIKLLEGFRAGLPVITTTAGAAGLPLETDRELASSPTIRGPSPRGTLAIVRDPERGDPPARGGLHVSRSATTPIAVAQKAMRRVLGRSRASADPAVGAFPTPAPSDRDFPSRLCRVAGFLSLCHLGVGSSSTRETPNVQPRNRPWSAGRCGHRAPSSPLQPSMLPAAEVAAGGANTGPISPAWQRIWLRAQAREWNTLALMGSSKRSPHGTMHVASGLARVSAELGHSLVILDGRSVDLRHMAAMQSRMRSLSSRDARHLRPPPSVGERHQRSPRPVGGRGHPVRLPRRDQDRQQLAMHRADRARPLPRHRAPAADGKAELQVSEARRHGVTHDRIALVGRRRHLPAGHRRHRAARRAQVRGWPRLHAQRRPRGDGGARRALRRGLRARRPSACRTACPLVARLEPPRRAKLPERVSGSDLVGPLMERAAARDLSVYFLGGAPGVAELAKHKLLERCPRSASSASTPR